jgi:hypothetical protein
MRGYLGAGSVIGGFAGGYGGTTAPPEITSFIPSATVIPKSINCCRGTRI